MIDLGHFLPGGQRLPSEEGINETYLGLIEVGPQSLRAYVKLLPDRQLVNELLASVLGRLLGLPVPRGFLVLVRQTDYPASKVIQAAGKSEVLGFAAEALTHRSLLRRLDLATPEARKLLFAAWKHWSAAASFDDWIANADRHPGNLLVGDVGELWLIDHSHAFTGDKWVATGLQPTLACGNQLCQAMNVWLSHAEKVDAIKAAHASAASFGSIDPMSAAKLARIIDELDAADLAALTAFLGQRCATVPTRISCGLGMPGLALESPQ